MPVLFPPGVPVPKNLGTEIVAHLAEPVERTSADDARSRYHQMAEPMRQVSIRCEGCGERYEDPEAYRLHACAVVYR